jgi:hypothetical protein
MGSILKYRAHASKTLLSDAPPPGLAATRNRSQNPNPEFRTQDFKIQRIPAGCYTCPSRVFFNTLASSDASWKLPPHTNTNFNICTFCWQFSCAVGYYERDTTSWRGAWLEPPCFLGNLRFLDFKLWFQVEVPLGTHSRTCCSFDGWLEGR